MSKQTINIGASPNDGTGTPLRTSFDYTNQNFTEIYTALGGGVALPGATTQVIFNDGGTNLAGDSGLTFNKTTDTLSTARITASGDAIVCSSTGDFYVGTTVSPQFKVERATGNATITGDLTVDTSTLKVDSTNNRVGIGTPTPAYLVDVLAAGASTVNDSFNVVRFTGASAVANDFSLVGPATSQVRLNFSHPTASGNGEVGYDHSTNRMRFVASGSEQYRIDPLGVFTWLNGAGGTRMTLDSTGLGIGVSPSNNLHIKGASGGTTIRLEAITDGVLGFIGSASGLIGSSPANNLAIRAENGLYLSGGGNAAQFILNSAGNVGIGVSTFGTSAAKVLSIATGTEPTTGPAGSVQFFTSTRSASNTIPAIFTEGSGVTNAAITNTTVTNKIAIKVNGTIYYLLATTSAA